ncbi:MAG: VTT domain-containing protein [Acidobacteria bacterium]|nr:VTT domain-containing protein [Acidobacteriota bacterium]
MGEALQFLVRHGYLVLFASVLAQQLGLPLPSTPFIIAAGALARSGQLSLPAALLVACTAAMLADFVWFEVGRRRGLRVLQFLCRISLEPDYCVRRTENTFARHGAKTLVFAKFVPGVSALTTPLAGANGLPLSRFLLFNGLGVLLWIGAFELLGYLFSDQLETVVAYAARFGGLLFAIVVGGLAAYVAWKYVQRRRFLRSLRVARVTPEELKAELDAGADLLIVDLRHALDHEAEPRTLPGALRLPAEEFENRAEEIPRGRTLILFCT